MPLFFLIIFLASLYFSIGAYSFLGTCFNILAMFNKKKKNYIIISMGFFIINFILFVYRVFITFFLVKKDREYLNKIKVGDSISLPSNVILIILCLISMQISKKEDSSPLLQQNIQKMNDNFVNLN